MPSTPLPENVIRSLSRFLFACIPPGQAVVQLFDPNYGDLYLVKGSDDSEQHSTPGSPGHDILSDLGLRSPPQALLNELVECLTLAAMQADKCHITIAPDAPTSPSPLTVGTLSSLTDLSDMSFADPGSLNTSAPLSDLRGSALFYGAKGEPQGVFSPSPPPPVSPTPHRSGSTLRLHGDSASRSHSSSGDASSSSTDGTAGSVYSQPSDNPGDEPYVTCASIAIQPSFTSEGSPVLGAGGNSSAPSSPLKLFGLSSLPTGLSPSPGALGSSFRTTTGGGLSPLSASHVTADFLAISPSPAAPDAAHLHAAGSPATSTPVRDAMRRALAVMIMHRHSPRARSGSRSGVRGRSTMQRRETPSPLARSELVRLPAGEAAARIVAAVKARERERTRAWAAAQRGVDGGVSAGKARL